MNTSKILGLIDLGSNTVKIKAGEFTDGIVTQICYESFDSSLTISEDTIDLNKMGELIKALLEIKQIIKKYNVSSYKAIATETIRKAKNQKEVLALIKKETDIDVEVISGEKEAELTLGAILMDFPKDEELICINVGGGSSEVILHSDKDDFKKMDIGAKTILTDYFKDETKLDNSIKEAEKKMNEVLVNSLNKPGSFSTDKVVAIGGTAYFAAKIIKKGTVKKFEEFDKMIFNISDLESVIKIIKNTPEAERNKIPGWDNERGMKILTGTLILYNLMKYYDKNEFQFSARSISDAALKEMSESII